MHKVAVVIGVRPHYVKACGLREILEGTGISPMFFDVHQHYDERMHDLYTESGELHLLSNSPARPPQSGVDDFSRQVNDVVFWLQTEEGSASEAVVVLGDATPALAGAVAASKVGKPIVHIEAGVRRIPSEREHWNSLIVDHMCSLRYCYTEASSLALKNEGLARGTYVVGDVLANWTIAKAARLSNEREENYCLVSIHRPQNCNEEAIRQLCSALDGLGHEVVWISHPRTMRYRHLVESLPHVEFIAPQEHDSALRLLKYADFIVTDSGGFVREGALLSKRVIVCHEQGMWTDLIDNHVIARADMSAKSIAAAVIETERLDVDGRHYFIRPGGVELFVESFMGFLEESSPDGSHA